MSSGTSIMGSLSASTSPATEISSGNSGSLISAPVVDGSGNQIAAPVVSGSSSGPWTPPQYGQPALTILTVPASAGGVPTSTSTASAAGITTSAPVLEGAPAINYVFDAVLRVQHRRMLKKTQHPVLTGANVADHAYIEPARVTLEIGMSDAMAAFSAGMWVGAGTKSISAWQILKGLQVSRTLLTLTTRLDTYNNMLIVDATSPDDNKTLHGLRATIVLEEIIAGSVASVAASSARPQTTGSSPQGVVQSIPISAAQQGPFVIPSAVFPDVQTYSQVPGAGNVSSNSLAQVPTK